MIEVKNMVAISGLSGVFKLVTARNNGLIIENYDTKERKFVPSRQHQFSPFETISIYTDTDAVALGDVFQNMKDQLEINPVPSEKSESPVLREYFVKVLPEHDRYRVHISDIKKVIKWFTFLNSRNLLNEKVAEAEENLTDESAESTNG